MRGMATMTAGFAAMIGLVVSGGCGSLQGPESVPRNSWWEGDGVVVPHDSFPGDCGLCHVGEDWLQLHPEFDFDHGQETGHVLRGAHEEARCLRCHNDRGPVMTFEVRGCAGCHEDVHQGRLGTDCSSCHGETSWQPVGMLELHARSRFPLIGAHAATACHRCHQGGEAGVFTPLDNSCVSCHQDDLARATNPNHQLLNLVDDCHRCHRPTDWHDAQNN